MSIVDTDRLANLNPFKVKCITPYATDAEIPGPFVAGVTKFCMTPNFISIIAVVSVCTYNKRVSAHMHRAEIARSSEVHRSLQNCGSLVWDFLHVTFPVLGIWGLLLDFGKFAYASHMRSFYYICLSHKKYFFTTLVKIKSSP